MDEDLRSKLVSLRERLNIAITALCSSLRVDLDAINSELVEVFSLITPHFQSSVTLSKDDHALISELAELSGACEQILKERVAFEVSIKA